MAEVASAGVLGVPIDVGAGTSSSFVQIDFNAMPGTESYLFEVHWSVTMDGFEALELIRDEAGLQLDAIFFDFDGDTIFDDAFVTELGYDGHLHTNDPFFGGNSWNYWTRDFDTPGDLQPWQSALVGSSDRVLEHGTWDGWTFGVFPGPTPQVPAPAALSALVLCAVTRKRRRASH
jgi:hypothetical protein